MAACELAPELSEWIAYTTRRSGKKADETYERTWFEELVARDEITFESDVFLLRKATAQALKVCKPSTPEPEPAPVPEPASFREISAAPGSSAEPMASTRTLRLSGSVPPELWNRLGTRILPKLRAGSQLTIGVDVAAKVPADSASSLATELRQVLQELGLGEAVRVD